MSQKWYASSSTILNGLYNAPVIWNYGLEIAFFDFSADANLFSPFYGNIGGGDVELKAAVLHLTEQ